MVGIQSGWEQIAAAGYARALCNEDTLRFTHKWLDLTRRVFWHWHPFPEDTAGFDLEKDQYGTGI